MAVPHARVVSRGTSSRVSVVGARELMAKLHKMRVGAEVGIRRVLANSGQRMVETAQALVPVDTGALREGITAQQVGPVTWAVEASSVAGGADREYAAFVEFGTYKMPARPYLRPAATLEKGYVNAELQKLGEVLVRL